MLAVFCERLNWRPLAVLVMHYRDRMSFGVQAELVPLMRIPGVKVFSRACVFERNSLNE
jgi:hypothetical protein